MALEASGISPKYQYYLPRPADVVLSPVSRIQLLTALQLHTTRLFSNVLGLHHATVSVTYVYHLLLSMIDDAQRRMSRAELRRPNLRMPSMVAPIHTAFVEYTPEYRVSSCSDWPVMWTSGRSRTHLIRTLEKYILAQQARLRTICRISQAPAAREATAWKQHCEV